LQPVPLPSILKTVKSNEKNKSRRVSVGLPVYYDYFSRYNNQDVKKYMADMSHCYRHTSKVAKQEKHYVQTEAEKWANHILHRTGRSVLPTQLHQPFNCCLDPATHEDLTAFIDECTMLKEEWKHAATTIQCAFRVPPTASSTKLSLWKSLYQEKIKSVVEEKKIKPESKPVIVATKLRIFKPSINSKKNRADRKTTLSSMRKNKKAANLARRRGLATSIQLVQVVQDQLILAVPSAPIKKKKKSITTSKLSRPIKLESAFELVQFISILSECALSSIPEIDEPIEITSILKTWKCKLLPIMEVDEPEEIKEEATTTTSSDASEKAQPFQLEQDAEAEDIEFGQADEPLVDSDAIPEAATPEPIQSPKKLQRRRCKAVESSLDGRYWSVSTRRRRKSSRVRRQPDFFTPS